MSEKKGFFGFLKGLSKEISDEEAQQREYARAKEREEENNFSGDSADDVQEQTVDQDIVDFCQEKLQEVLDIAGYDSEVKITRVNGDRIFLNILSEVDMGRIIGKDGMHLESLQTLLRAFVYKKSSSPVRILLDAGGYRKKRRNTLKNKALEAAQDAASTGKPVALAPMNSAERRAIHMLFENDDQIVTTSEGSGAGRHVVLSAKS